VPGIPGILQAGNGQTFHEAQPRGRAGSILAGRPGASSLYLAELVLEIVARALNGGEDALINVFQGMAFGSSFGTRGRFAKVKLVKSAPLRARSTEMYLLAKDFRLV